MDLDALLLARVLVLRAYMGNAVGVDIKGDFDLGHAAWLAWNTSQIKASEGSVIAGKLAFALQHMDGHRRLIVICSGENL